MNRSQFEKWFREADLERRHRVCRIKSDLGKMQSLCADGLAREMVAQGLPPSAVEFSRNEHGKPYAVNSPLHFNLSHSGDFVLCAVSEDEIGADIEILKPVAPSLIRRVCTEEEQDFIGEDDHRFLAVWTAKEALAKYSGHGLNGDLKTLSVVRSGHLQVPGLCLHTELTEEYALAILYKT